MRKAFVLVILLSGVLPAAVACSNQRSWAYAPSERLTIEPTVEASLVVPPFVDRRENENSNYWAMYMIPLMPFGWQTFETPEGVSMHAVSGQWKFSPPDDFARAVAQEIDAARVFREAFTDPRPSAGTYMLTGEIVSTEYHGKTLSYGLSLWGPLLWWIGFPAGYTTNELELHLTLTQPPSEEPLWTHTIRADDSSWHWIYVLGSDFNYHELLKSEIPGMMTSLREAVGGAAP